MRSEQRAERTSAVQAFEQLHGRSIEAFASPGEHPAEVVILQVPPEPFDAIEPLGGVLGEPEGVDPLSRSSQRGQGQVGGEGPAIVEHQHDAPSCTFGPADEFVHQAHEESRVDALGPMREEEGPLWVAVGTADRNSDVLTWSRDEEPLTLAVPHLPTDRQQVEPNAVGVPQLEVRLRRQCCPLEGFQVSLGTPFFPLGPPG